MAFTELHFHLLPGVDDGPATTVEAIALARLAVADGTGTIVATPHVRPDAVDHPLELSPRLEQLRADLAEAGVDVAVVGGGEVGHMIVSQLSDDELQAVALGPAHARFILLEAPFDGPAGDFHSAANQLRARGFGVLVGHPERSPCLMERGAEGARRELRRGSRLQVNAGSLLADHGNQVAIHARVLVAAGLVTAIASDAHGPHRPPLLGRGLAAARECGLPKGSAGRLADAGPVRLLERGIPTGALMRSAA